MILEQARVGHSISGRFYLAPKEDDLSAHKKSCQKAYGNLYGVRFYELPIGSVLTPAGSQGEYWSVRLPPNRAIITEGLSVKLTCGNYAYNDTYFTLEVYNRAVHEFGIAENSGLKLTASEAEITAYLDAAFSNTKTRAAGCTVAATARAGIEAVGVMEKPAISRVFMICNSYESGFGHGLANDGLDLSATPHADPEMGEAYDLGYTAGWLAQNDKPADPATTMSPA